MGRDPKKVIGDVNEFKAVIKFLKEGYMVFKNVSGTGPIDLVLVHQKTGEIRKIDVKTTSYRQIMETRYKNMSTTDTGTDKIKG
jgi:hypothetical protein